MAIVVLYHHVLGLTPGVVALADALRAGGHTVVTPDLFGGRTFATIDEGLAFVRASGCGDSHPDGPGRPSRRCGRVRRRRRVVRSSRCGCRRPAALGAWRSLLRVLHRPAVGAGGWDRPVPLQVHAMAADPFFLDDEPAAREWVAGHPEAELVTYAGDRHLFTDSSTAAYDAAATAVERSLAFLPRGVRVSGGPAPPGPIHPATRDPSGQRRRLVSSTVPA